MERVDALMPPGMIAGLDAMIGQTAGCRSEALRQAVAAGLATLRPATDVPAQPADGRPP
jgi:hypothetical protein